MPHFRIYLPGGLLKVKSRNWLREEEVDRKVPVRKLFGLYFIWLSNRRKR